MRKHNTRSITVKGVAMVQCRRCLNRWAATEDRSAERCPGRPGRIS
jgi:hypothetical protein